MFLLTLDGFSTAALSCYGSSWNPTPHLDQIAATGTLWDRAVTPHTSTDGQFRAWLADPRLPAGSITLVTDHPELANISHADRLDEIIFAESSPTEVAQQIEETALARLLAIALTRLDDSEILWLHSRFLTTAWDAPRDLFPIDAIEHDRWDDDEESEVAPESSIPPPPPIFETLQPPGIQLSGNEHPDLITAWMRTYGCQIRLVDSLLGVLASALAEENAELSMPILVGGTSGFALGQNGWFGHRAGPIRSCHLHVPMLTSHPGPHRQGAGVRSHRVTSSDDLVPLCNSIRKIDSPAPISPEQFAAAVEDDAVVSHDDNEPMAVTTASWFFNQTDGALFLKPDDAQDVNDVARLQPDVVEELAERLKG